MKTFWLVYLTVQVITHVLFFGVAPLLTLTYKILLKIYITP